MNNKNKLILSFIKNLTKFFVISFNILINFQYNFIWNVKIAILGRYL